MNGEVLVHLVLPALGAGCGAFAAGIGAPAFNAWSTRGEELRLRLRSVQVNRPRGVAPAWLSRLALAALLASGGLAAFAAEPGAPQQLPSEVVGVLGSGDQLSLQVKDAAAGAARTVKLGDEYKDGWRLQSLTNTVATLAKDGQVKTVGLNPTGAMPAPSADGGPPSTVLATLDAAQLAKLQDAVDTGYWNGAALPGLSLRDTQAVVLADLTIRDARAARLAQYGPGPQAVIPMAQLPDVLGRDTYLQIAQINAKARVPLPDSDGGPTTLQIPPGGHIVPAAQAGGVPILGAFYFDKDSQGVTTAVRVPMEDMMRGTINPNTVALYVQ